MEISVTVDGPSEIVADISFITTCMGRLEHLQQSLPTWVGQSGTEIVMVDFSCPEKSGDWVSQAHPEVNVVRCGNEPHFRLAYARNAGAAVAKGRWLCFVDADVLLAPEFTAAVKPILQDNHFYRAEQGAPEDLLGTVLIPRGAFEAAGGYDEVLEGWGAEDTDLYLRLQKNGLRQDSFSSLSLAAIPHGDELRTEHAVIRDRKLGWNVNRLYLEAKFSLWRVVGKEPDLETRRSLYALVRSVVLAGADQAEVRVELALGRAPSVTPADVQQSLVLVLRNPSGR